MCNDVFCIEVATQIELNIKRSICRISFFRNREFYAFAVYPIDSKTAATILLLYRAATDLANPNPDLLTTRIQSLRSGSVKRICFLIFSFNFKFISCLDIFHEKICLFKNLQRNWAKKYTFGVFLLIARCSVELTDPNLSIPGPGSNFSDPWQLYSAV